MDSVVYILGAGFSAPLGLPVMADFILKSKDMYAAEPDRLKYFSQVFRLIDSMSVAKHYYHADLFNIEELLSILEMRTFLERRGLRKVFLEYIAEVVNHSTPEMTSYRSVPSTNSGRLTFRQQGRWQKYALFFGSLMRLSLARQGSPAPGGRVFDFPLERLPHHSPAYGIITLNYDCLPEIFAQFCNAEFTCAAPVAFQRQDIRDLWSSPSLAKLHGCAKDGRIIPPTWSKGSHQFIAPTWRMAYRMLVEATDIRFVGYSLPASDAYVKYLLAAASLKAQRLKSIDVLCLDPDDSVSARYADFIDFRFFRFANARTEEYLDALQARYSDVGSRSAEKMQLTGLEAVHQKFMQEAQQRHAADGASRRR
jgi:hypothetical protein